ncbi:hypothetical protein J6590_091009 [Homalodisca vitripennis]|nr:hypothetical protein J6590_091009 [Homalodisca vitripennis]
MDKEPDTGCKRDNAGLHLTISIALKNDKDWTVQKRLLSARRASQMGVFPSQLISSSSNE